MEQKEKLLVIVPYRDRQSHLEQFIPYIKNSLKNKNIQNKVVIVEQRDNNPFNRGMLLNIGFVEAAHFFDYDYICLHDIDMIGEGGGFDYEYEPFVVHLSALEKNRNYAEWYKHFLGGVTLFPKEDFIKINGFYNDYWSWGCEDDDLWNRCQVMGVNCQRKRNSYFQLDHKSNENKRTPLYLKNRDRLDDFIKKKDTGMIFISGLNNVKDKYKDLNLVHYEDYTLISANLIYDSST